MKRDAIWPKVLALLTLVTLALPRLAASQQDTLVQGSGGSAAIGRDVSNSTVNVFNGISDLSGIVVLIRNQEEETAKARAAVAALEQRLASVAALEQRQKLDREAVIGILRVAGEREVAPEQLPLVLAQVTERYQDQLQRLNELESALATDDPEIGALVKQARAAIAVFDFGGADKLLEHAEQADLAAAMHARALAKKAIATADARQLRAAATRAERGETARTDLRYREAAEHFMTAAQLVPDDHEDDRLAYLQKAALAWTAEGDERGDNVALDRAIALYRDMLRKAGSASPTQMTEWSVGLGTALTILGKRTDDVVVLNEAVEVLQVAESNSTQLSDTDRFEVKILQAGTLATLGARQATTQSFEVAIGLLQAQPSVGPLGLTDIVLLRAKCAESEITRSLAWRLREFGRYDVYPPLLKRATRLAREAVSSSRASSVGLEEKVRAYLALGEALQANGFVQRDKSALVEAGATYETIIGLQGINNRPREWGAAKHGLGKSLQTLAWLLGEQGDLLGKRAKLEASAKAFQDALTKRSLEDRPLEWAATKVELAQTYFQMALAGDERLKAIEAAVDAYAAASEELLNKDAQADWLEAQQQLAVSTRTLGWALWEAGRHDEARQQLVKAVDLFRAVADKRSRERWPDRWSDAQYDLGKALYELGKHGDVNLLQEAVYSYRNSLTVRSIEATPELRAMALTDLAASFWELGIQRKDQQAFTMALDCYEQTRQIHMGRSQGELAGARLRDMEAVKATAENLLGVRLTVDANVQACS